MSNLNKDHPSIRLHAPPGGHSSNIFGGDEFEQSAANKKKHTQSDIFGCKPDNNEPAPNKPARSQGNNIFGTDPEPTVVKSHMNADKNKSTIFNETPSNPDEQHGKLGTLAGQYKQNQMKSSIFDETPTASRPVSDKNKSNIFGSNEQDEQNKRSTGIRQGLRVGYNPINGEAYAPAAKDEPVKAEANASSENVQPTTNDEKPTIVPDQPTAQKPVHTSVRVFHPPGGRSNGPLW